MEIRFVSVFAIDGMSPQQRILALLFDRVRSEWLHPSHSSSAVTGGVLSIAPRLFQPIADGVAAITGDFVLIDKEVKPVARVLRQHGIDVTALHNHGREATPRLFYMHFWANDDAGKLSEGPRAALDQTNSQK